MPSRKNLARWFGCLILFASLTLAACQAKTPTSATVSAPTVAQTSAPNVTASPAPPAASAPPAARSLIICLGQEPTSLYIYGSAARDMWNVLEAIYDGPIDTRNYVSTPVILEKLPNLPDGTAAIQPVTVQAGDEMVDADGNLASLTSGVKYLPSGCSGADCAVPWDGKSAVQMDQLSATFKLKPGITWSDGQPLTAADSVYSYQLAADPATPTSKKIVDRTASYTAVDDLTVRWTGLPGYIPQQYDANFFLPLPKHAWGSTSAANLLTSDAATRRPLGWGPYVIDEWVAGDHITLSKNPKYFRASEGLPKFDRLVYRFVGEPADSSLSSILAGECDLVDNTALQSVDYQSIFDMRTAKKIQLFTGEGPEWEHLDFGIRPAAYDTEPVPTTARPDFFGDVRVRQAFAYCIDRQKIVGDLLYNLVSVPGSYLPPDHPLNLPDLKPLPFDVDAGKKLLDDAGWKQAGSDSVRRAVDVANVPAGTPLAVTYLTTQAPLRVAIAGMLKSSLEQCGVQVDVKSLTTDALYAAGPDGPLFGRSFDLAEYAWSTSAQPPCFLYSTAQIPSSGNNWLTGNVTGYSNADYDAACQKAIQARPDQPDQYTQGQQAAERILAQDLPSIPLFFQLKMTAARTDLCGFAMDVTARSALWGIENLDYGPKCK
jgi:peptide/nickel transport system substrate-binding protein